MAKKKPATVSASATDEEQKRTIDPDNPAAVLDRFPDSLDEDAVKKEIPGYIKELQSHFGLDEYEVILLFDEADEISTWHSDKIYSAANRVQDKDILLIIHSLGGRIEPAYLISKTCKRLSKNKFSVAIPRKAKSAATLISLGADEIHMGFMSELGPIDPQIGGLPALGMQNALHVLADLSCKYPDSSDMLSKYLSEKLDLRLLGYFERVTESAVQYADRLLANRSFPEGRTSSQLAKHFVNHYKDHGFVIDIDEATQYLGDDIIKCNESEYRFANAVHEMLDFLDFCVRRALKRSFDFVGSVDTGLRTFQIKKS